MQSKVTIDKCGDDILYTTLYLRRKKSTSKKKVFWTISIFYLIL